MRSPVPGYIQVGIAVAAFAITFAGLWVWGLHDHGRLPSGRELLLRVCSHQFEHHIAAGHVRRATWWSGMAVRLLGIRFPA